LQIWHVEIQVTGAVKVEFAADLQRHQRAVNVVRFSPSGEFLASADDGKLTFYVLCVKLKHTLTLLGIPFL
jgi:chromatin assembly factor 1 subunit B